MADIYIRSRKQRYEIGRLVNEGKTFKEAEDIVMAGDSNRSRQITNWRKRELFPYGNTDSPDGIDSVPDVPEIRNTRQQISKPPVLPKIDEEALLERLLAKLDDNALLKIATVLQKGTLQVLESIRPQLKKEKSGYPVSFRLNKELVDRVKKKLERDEKGETLTGLIERLLFNYIGEPADLLDTNKMYQMKGMPWFIKPKKEDKE